MNIARFVPSHHVSSYTELTLATVSAAVNSKSLVTLHPEVERFVDMVYREAGEKRETYLTVTLDALELKHIQKARNVLNSIVFAQQNAPALVPDAVQQFYSLIPTKLPARIDKDAVVKAFIANLSEQEERLDQFEAAVASYQAQGQQADPDSPLKALGGVLLKPLPQSEQAFGQIADMIEKTGGSAKSITSILQIKIPTERAAYEADTFGKHNVLSLFHGTRGHYLQPILRTGLLIPRIPANGRRFGNGVYFADRVALSLRYAQGSTRTLFITDVAVGDQKVVHDENSSISAAPAGYHSVIAPNAHQNSLNAGFNEHIVYRTQQQTIRAVVLF